jgi:hypothetical protein
MCTASAPTARLSADPEWVDKGSVFERDLLRWRPALARPDPLTSKRALPRGRACVNFL